MIKVFHPLPGPLDEVAASWWHPVARASEVREGEVVAAEVLSVPLVVWRSDEGWAVFEDLCIHRGAKLSPGRVESGRLVCPYHAWRYDGTGRCVHIPAQPGISPPARARANAFACCEYADLVWVCLGEPQGDPPQVEGLGSARYRVQCQSGPYRIRAAAPRVIENFIDVAHLGIVHAGILGLPDYADVPDYTVDRTPSGLRSSPIELNFPIPDAETGRPVSRIPFVYSLPMPFVAQLTVAKEEIPYSVWMAVTPVSERESLGWVWLLNTSDQEASELIRKEDEILGQDIPVVESQRPELLPVDMQAELHLRSDRLAIAYRQWVKELGLTFGVG
ncbi:MAG: aromatic ring-hydroxylating dioxygenase subunit alpha [Verrucomicrobiia bacterium]